LQNAKQPASADRYRLMRPLVLSLTARFGPSSGYAELI
jgi:hypothetical protein